MNSDLLQIERKKGAEARKNGSVWGNGDFRARTCAFSLGFRPIGPSVFDGARRKVVTPHLPRVC